MINRQTTFSFSSIVWPILETLRSLAWQTIEKMRKCSQEMLEMRSLEENKKHFLYNISCDGYNHELCLGHHFFLLCGSWPRLSKSSWLISTGCQLFSWHSIIAEAIAKRENKSWQTLTGWYRYRHKDYWLSYKLGLSFVFFLLKERELRPSTEPIIAWR